jgi:site-specific recombinase XerD
MTLIPILETYSKHLLTLGKSVHTVKAYAHDLTGFAQWFAQTTGETFDPQTVGPRDIAEYRSYLLTRGKKPATVNRRLVALQRFYKWAQKQGHTNNNPFESLEGVRVKQQQGIAPKWLDGRQQQALLRAVRKGKSLRDLAIIETLMRTGLRVSELIDLTLADVVLSERTGKVIVRAGKGGKYREVPLSKEVRYTLEMYLQAREEERSPRLFLGQRGPLNVPGIQYLVAKYAYQARLQDVTPHSLRHTLAKIW